MPELPRGTVTFLFTDIEGSTRLLAQLRERYGEVLATHHRLLREAIEQAGGEEVGTEGDAFFVAFRRAREAVAAAVAAQTALAREPWPDGAEVRVRMGMHTGEPEVGEAGYHGLALHRAARICDAGHGGQILLSNATRELVEDDLPAGVTLRELGAHRLKDLDRPERLAQLVVDGLRNEFPPLNTLDERRGWIARVPLRARVGAGLAAVATAVAVPLLTLGGGTGGSTSVAPDSLGVIDPRTNEVVAQVPVGAGPARLAAGQGALWVANLDDRTVSHVDLRERRVRKAIPIGEVPGDLAAGAGGVWAVSGSSTRSFANVRRIDAAFDNVVDTIRVPGSAFGGAGGAIAAGDGVVWAATGGVSELSRIDPRTNEVVAMLDAGTAPSSIVVGGGAVWVADSSANTVTRIRPDLNSVVATIRVGRNPNGIAFGEGALWVADSLDNAVVRIDPDTNAVKDTITVGRAPLGVAVGEGAVWTANFRDGTVSRIDPSRLKVVKTIQVGGSPLDVAVAAGHVWVSVQARSASGAEAAARGGTARVSSLSEADSLDPALASGGLSWQIEYATCAKLVNYPDRPPPFSSQIVPEVADALPEVSGDGRTYTFTIGKGFRFSPPSGEPVTAQTFKYAIERSLSPHLRRAAARDVNRPELGEVAGAKAYASGTAAHIAGIVARGDTLTVNLTEPAPDLLARLAQPFFCAVPLNTPVDPTGVLSVPAAGPYYVASRALGRIVLRRNPNYSGPRPHRLREIDIALGVAQEQSVAQVESGDVDYSADGVPAKEVARLTARYGAAKGSQQRFFVNRRAGVDYFILNARRPLFASARLRRAVNYAIDRTALSATDLSPAAPADHYLPPGLSGYRPARIYPLRPDVATARRLAGGRHGTAVLYTCNLLECMQSAQIVKQNLAAIGIDVSVESFALGAYLAKLGRADSPFDIALFGLTAADSDPGRFLQGLSLFGRWDEPKYERKLRAAAARSGARRYLSLGTFDLDVTRNAAPLAAFANEVSQDFFSARIGCQVFNPLYGIDLAALCIRG